LQAISKPSVVILIEAEEGEFLPRKNLRFTLVKVFGFEVASGQV